MVHDSWLKIRISSDLVDALRDKYGKGVSGVVRGFIEDDLGVDEKSDADALVGDNGVGRITWKDRLELQKKTTPTE